MTSPGLTGSGVSGGRAPFVDWGVVYKVGVGVAALGLLVIVGSAIFGGLVQRLVMEILELLGAPDDRAFLSRDASGTGGALLFLYGFCLLACGACVFSVRLALELPGLTGQQALTAGMSLWAKLTAGAGAAGVLLLSIAALVEFLFLLFIREDDDMGTRTGAALTTGAVLIGVAIVAYLLGGAGRRAFLLGWTDRMGWGRVRCGWINRIGLALLVAAVFFTLLPFSGLATPFIIIGLIALLSGVIPHYLRRGRP